MTITVATTTRPVAIEYRPVDPLCLHPDTHELIQREYLYLKESYPTCTPIQQIYNTIMHFAPDLHAAVASIQQATKRLIADIRAYASDTEKLARALPYLEDFCERVQETSAYLHNGEPAKREAIAQFNESWARMKQMEEEARERWDREVATGDAYFGGPGSYQRARDAHYATSDLKEWKASGDRIRAFRVAYHQGEQPQRELAPVQAGLWQEAIR